MILVKDIIFGMVHLVLKGYVWYSEKCILCWVQWAPPNVM